MALTLDQVNRIIAAALQHATQSGYKPMGVVVLDDAGHLKSAQRQDGASMFRIDIATGKAWASVGMGAASRVLTQRAKDGRQETVARVRSDAIALHRPERICPQRLMRVESPSLRHAAACHGGV